MIKKPFNQLFTGDQRVLNKLVEEAIEYVCARDADFVDAIDRQLVQFLKTYLYSKQNKPSED